MFRGVTNDKALNYYLQLAMQFIKGVQPLAEFIYVGFDCSVYLVSLCVQP